MSFKIIILNSNTQADGSFSVSGVFWLTAPSNNIMSNPKAQSSVHNINASGITALRAGTVVEQPFNSGLFPSGTSNGDVQSSLQDLFNAAQDTLNNTNPPISGLVGNSFDGTTWAAPNFIPAPVVPSAVALYTTSAPQPLTSDGRLRISSEKTNTARTTLYSHDWTDPTTWTQNAVRVVDEVATDSGDHKTYTLAHQNVIDTKHGKITSEDYLKSADGYSYAVQVKVNDVTKTAQDPHYRDGYNDGYGLDGYSTALGDGQDKDYFVQYSNGKITFINALASDAVVKVTYFYATNSVFTIKPTAGKNLRLDLAEVQFSSDVIMTDSVMFQPYGFVEAFAPQYCPSPYPAGTLIPLGNPLIYKHMNDFQNDATRAYPVYAPLGGTGWRGAPQSTVIFDWDYVSSTVLDGSKGMEIRISLQHNKKFEGYYATATFYCVIENG